MVEDKTQKPAREYTNFERLVIEYIAFNDGFINTRLQARQMLSYQHTDGLAVDTFAQAMKEKMADAHAKGRSGWECMSPFDLSRMLREHVEKGDPCDVANFCMMLWYHGAQIAPQPQAAEPKGMMEEQRNALMRSYFETIAKYLEADLPGLALNTAEKARALLTKGE